MEFKDTYKTIGFFSHEILFKENNSKFFVYTFIILSENEIKSIIKSSGKQHPNISQYSNAYQIGTDTTIYRTNDDDETINSKGMSINRQIQSFAVSNVLVVVV